jgi:flagellar motility protein MotE (MotC chaperone)
MEERKMRKTALTIMFMFLIVPFLTNERIVAETEKTIIAMGEKAQAPKNEEMEKRLKERKAFRETLSDEEKAKLQKKGESIADRIKNLTPQEKAKLKESSLTIKAITENLSSGEKERLKSCYENSVDTLTNIPVEQRNQLKHNFLYLIK